MTVSGEFDLTSARAAVGVESLVGTITCQCACSSSSQLRHRPRIKGSFTYLPLDISSLRPLGGGTAREDDGGHLTHPLQVTIGLTVSVSLMVSRCAKSPTYDVAVLLYAAFTIVALYSVVAMSRHLVSAGLSTSLCACNSRVEQQWGAILQARVRCWQLPCPTLGRLGAASGSGHGGHWRMAIGWMDGCGQVPGVIVNWGGG